jgi:hypothetical protein
MGAGLSGMYAGAGYVGLLGSMMRAIRRSLFKFFEVDRGRGDLSLGDEIGVVGFGEYCRSSRGEYGSSLGEYGSSRGENGLSCRGLTGNCANDI